MSESALRVMYITQGDAVHDRRFLRALREAGIELAVMRLTGVPARAPLPAGTLDLTPRAEANRRAVGRTLRLRNHLRKSSREFAPDVVHAGPIQDGAFLAGLAGLRPLIGMSWGSDLLLGARRGVGRWKARWALSRSRLLLCDCQAVRQAALGLGATEDHIVVFPWGVDLDRFRPGRERRLRRALGWDDAFVLLSARGFEPIYGVDVLVDAFLLSAPTEPHLRLLLLGDGSLRPALERRIELAGLRARVHFAGPVPEEQLPDYYRAADLYVSASHSDGTSVSLLEAMACGRPVVVSALASNQEWVRHEVNGWVFADGDRQALAAHLRRADDMRSQLATMGGAARATVEQGADWRRSSRQLIDSYRMVAGRVPI